ncbi:hypothetical protein BHU60_06345 [Klebsiella pneumoniae]|nr:hypothetical protein BHU60_06345 [Klebsiella pneumoniae]
MIWFKSSFRGIMFNDVLDVNGPQVFAAPGAADAKAGSVTPALTIQAKVESLD